MNKFASAHWQGDIKQGKGTISTQSGALKGQPYGFNTRFEDEPGTNPEELIGGAHAGCFSMAFSLQLGNAGYTPDSIDTEAKVTLEKDGDGFSITKVHLDMTAKIPGIDDDEFQKIAKAAKEGCPVSKLLNADISLDAKLQS
ncbi:MAG: OsmC family protein [Alcanivorax sp.]|nr:OsmC family protein [Alcanivorax sp.]